MIVILRSLVYGAIYAVLTGIGEPANWELGMVLGTGLSFVVGRRHARRVADWPARLAWSPVLLWGMARRVIRGSWQMVHVLIGRRPWQHVGFVECSAIAETPEGVTLLALIHSASPGSVAAEVERESRTLILNIIDAREARQEEESIRRFYDRYQKYSVP